MKEQTNVRERQHIHGPKLGPKPLSALKRPKLGLLRRCRGLFLRYQYAIVIGIIFFVIVFGIIASIRHPSRRPAKSPVNDVGLITFINAESPTFQARSIPMFDRWILSDVRRIYGRVMWSQAIEQTPECQSTDLNDAAFLPQHFDAREKWPLCFYESFESGKCSSSWATATADMLSNRLCISDQDQYSNIRLSPQDFLSCDTIDRGCEAGGLDIALYHALARGIVTTTCFPYKGTTDSVSCDDRCTTETPTRVASYCRAKTASEIKKEIQSHGPLTAIMLLYDDFLVYGGGVYKPSSRAVRLVDASQRVLTHAITLLGWGEENGIAYWIIQSNFGPSWGEHGGYGRIARDAGVIVEENVLSATFAPSVLPMKRTFFESENTFGSKGAAAADSDDWKGRGDNNENEDTNEEELLEEENEL